MKNDIDKNNDDKNTTFKLQSEGADECIFIVKESVSKETVLNALMTLLYSVSIGPEGNDYNFAIHTAEEYLAFVKGKAKKPTLKLL